MIDIENECVLDDGGLGIEYVGKSFFNYYEDSQHLNVWFKLPDSVFEEADEQFLWIDQRVHDLSGNPYDIIFCRQSNQYGLGFDASQGIPAAVKVEVTGIPKGIMEPVRVKLKTKYIKGRR